MRLFCLNQVITEIETQVEKINVEFKIINNGNINCECSLKHYNNNNINNT